VNPILLIRWLTVQVCLGPLQKNQARIAAPSPLGDETHARSRKLRKPAHPGQSPEHDPDDDRADEENEEPRPPQLGGREDGEREADDVGDASEVEEGAPWPPASPQLSAGEALARCLRRELAIRRLAHSDQLTKERALPRPLRIPSTRSSHRNTRCFPDGHEDPHPTLGPIGSHGRSVDRGRVRARGALVSSAPVSGYAPVHARSRVSPPAVAAAGPSDDSASEAQPAAPSAAGDLS